MNDYDDIFDLLTSGATKERTNKNTSNLYEGLEREMDDIDDITCVYANNTKINVDAFLDVAKDIWYYSGYGEASIHGGLKVYTKDGIYYRYVYDGSESWEFMEFRTE